ncbi:YceI family protein [uncultured Draconibacterium sp.]|uniref:YceI family protein n=1 Tax=uncultured Draconibacterium sp. TaxID=1573823 RepID=UPI00326097E9
MKKLVTVFAIIIAIGTSAFAADANADKSVYKVDTNASKVYWTGKKVTGEHTGYINLSDGEVHVKDEKVVGAQIKIDVQSIEVTDLSGEWKDKLVGHLKSDDFFSAEKHPVATFAIKTVDATDKGYQVVGDLTIKGITKQVAFPAEVKVDGSSVSATGTATIDRTEYDIRYGSGKFFSDLGDNMINDNFEITFELKATAAN